MLNVEDMKWKGSHLHIQGKIQQIGELVSMSHYSQFAG